MKITPLEISKKQFPTQLRGLDRDAVESYLAQIVEQMEELVRENAELKESCSKKDMEIAGCRQMEQDLSRTILNTRQMVKEFQDRSAAEIESLKRSAESEATRTIEDAQEKAVKIHGDISGLKKLKKHMKRELSMLIQNHLKMLETHEKREQILLPLMAQDVQDQLAEQPCEHSMSTQL